MSLSLSYYCSSTSCIELWPHAPISCYLHCRVSKVLFLSSLHMPLPNTALLLHVKGKPLTLLPTVTPATFSSFTTLLQTVNRSSRNNYTVPDSVPHTLCQNHKTCYPPQCNTLHHCIFLSPQFTALPRMQSSPKCTGHLLFTCRRCTP